MLKRYSIFWSRLFLLCDWVLLTLAVHVAHRISTGHWLELSDLVSSLHVFSAIVLLSLWLLFSRAYALYASKRFFSILEDAKSTVATIVSVVTAYSLVQLVASSALFQLHIPLTILLATLVVPPFHYAVRIGLRFLRSGGRNQRQVLIYGAGQLGQQVALNIAARPWMGLNIMGFLDDDIEKHGTLVCGYEVIGGAIKGREIIQNQRIDELIITLPSNAYSHIIDFILDIQRAPVNIRVVPDLLQLVSVKAHIEDLWGTPVIGIRQPVIDGFDAMLKRAVDVVGALVGLVLASPIMLITALLIKLDSPGPIFFVQERVGQNGHIFKMIKFRTMVTDAEKQLEQLIDFEKLDQPMFKIKNDPRITRIGRLLRRTSIDELPQLFNVLRGDMSLVGPRPEEKRVVDMYSYWHRRRLATKPGLTGPMQVGGRGDLSLDERISIEVHYIENYSLLLDFEIILLTVPAVLFAKGAY